MDSPTADTATNAPTRRQGSTIGWLIAFVLFPYGPFLYLAWMRKLGWLEAVSLVVASALVHVGLVSVLAKTNHQPWQPWLVLLLGTGMYCLGLIQYLTGVRSDAWSRTGRRIWRAAGWLFGLLLLIGLLSQVAIFHMRQT